MSKDNNISTLFFVMRLNLVLKMAIWTMQFII